MEAQRLGLEAHSSDLNPVAVLITKALIEITPKFANKSPVNPDSQSKTIPNPKSKIQNPKFYYGAQGLAEDVRYYGQWIRDEAFKRIGHLYPKVNLPQEYGGGEATVIAWLWARTVKCPNPACGAKMPLTSKFWLSTKKNKQAWVETIIDRNQQPPVVRFQVQTGKGKPPDGTVNRKGATCICCSTPVPFDYIRREGKAGRMNAQLMAIVAEGQRGRVYLSPIQEHEEIVASAKPEWKPESPLPHNPRNFNTPIYGIDTFDKLFTSRQLVALTTFSSLVSEAREKVLESAVATGMPDDSLPLNEGGTGATAYADAVATYLANAVDRLADRNSTICSWDVGRDSTRSIPNCLTDYTPTGQAWTSFNARAAHRTDATSPPRGN